MFRGLKHNGKSCSGLEGWKRALKTILVGPSSDHLFLTFSLSHKLRKSDGN